MKRIIGGILVSALALAGGAIIGTPAYAATASTLVMSGGSSVFGLDPAVIVATANNAGAVKFSVNGSVVVGCEAVNTTLVTPFVAKCTWAPAKAGANIITGSFTPADLVNFSPIDSLPFTVKTGTPVQGVVSPISIYADTVLASGSTGALAPRFGVGCSLTGEFIVGQTIVFRIYANNADLGGAPMDSTNTAKAYIEIPGVKDPIQLAYGNHSGVAFWSGVLKTGTAPGLYSTLGNINYKVTMVAKDQTTAKVLATKLVRKTVNGVTVRDGNGAPVYERVSYFKTVNVNPALKGATGTWQNNFTAASWLSLFAVPTA